MCCVEPVRNSTDNHLERFINRGVFAVLYLRAAAAVWKLSRATGSAEREKALARGAFIQRPRSRMTENRVIKIRVVRPLPPPPPPPPARRIPYIYIYILHSMPEDPCVHKKFDKSKWLLLLYSRTITSYYTQYYCQGPKLFDEIHMYACIRPPRGSDSRRN